MLWCVTSQKKEGLIKFCLQAVKNVRKLLLAYISCSCIFLFYLKKSSDVAWNVAWHSDLICGFIHNSPIAVSSSVRCTLLDSNIISHSVALNGKTVIEYELNLKRISNWTFVDEFKVLSQIWTEGIEEYLAQESKSSNRGQECHSLDRHIRYVPKRRCNDIRWTLEIRSYYCRYSFKQILSTD